MEEKKFRKKKETPDEPDENKPGLPEEAVTLTKGDWKNLTEQAAKAGEHHDHLLRLAADFENFRRRTAVEKEKLAGFAESLLLTKFLPVLDSIEQVLKFGDEEENKESLNAGLKLVAKEIHHTFRDLGLKPLEVLGKPFDPHTAEAVEVTEDPDSEEGTVLSILRTGYQYKNRVLRPALVRISKKPQDKSDQQSDATNGNPRPGED